MLHRVLAATLLLATPLLLHAQEPERESEDRLDAVLPAAEAERVQLLLTSARERGVEAPLGLFVREMLAKGVTPELVVEGTERRAEEFSRAAVALAHARSDEPSDEEIVAGAESMRRGVSGEAIAELASSAPSGRSLAVPLLVLAELVDRGLPADAAIDHVRERLLARATDTELRAEPARVRSQARPTTPPGLSVAAAARGSNARIPARPPQGRGRP